MEVPPKTHIERLLRLVKTRIGSPKIRDIVLRGDAAYGKASIVNKCIEQGYLFKGMHTSSAKKYAKRVREWIKINESEELYAGEFRGRIRGSKHNIRVVVFKHVNRDGKEGWWYLLTNLPDIPYPKQQLFKLYHEKQGIEAYLKCDKSGLHLKNLGQGNSQDQGLHTPHLHNPQPHRPRPIIHQTHRQERFHRSEGFVEKLACSKAWFTRKGSLLVLAFTKENPSIKQYIKCIQSPTLLDYIT